MMIKEYSSNENWNYWFSSVGREARHTGHVLCYFEGKRGSGTMRVHTFLIHGSRQSLWKICWQGRESTGSVWEKSVSQTEQAELIARGDSRAEQRDTKFFLCGQVQRQRVNKGGGGGWGTVLGIVKCPEKSRNVHAGGRGPSNDSQWQ